MGAVVVAAGSGSRLGADVPKALVPVGGVPLVVHAVARLLGSGVSAVVVAAPAAFVDQFRVALAEVVPDGGQSGLGADGGEPGLGTDGGEPALVADGGRAALGPDGGGSA
ncbi:MAG: NTP transferase domain-containing protein, partial [Actinomycetota bacterium]|nr:NTP transferase domain-containing protein [Actinomycetota bacterium]